jgi:competence protein ComEA
MSFSKNNRRGLILLIIITIGVIYAPRVVMSLKPASKIDINEYELVELADNLKEETALRKSKSRVSSSYKLNKYKRPAHKFDPNKYKLNDWMKLGLSEKQSEIVLKFSKRGIYSNEDLAKIFVISEELLFLIKDSTVFPEKKVFEKNKTELISLNVELNSCSKEDLIALKGIGEYYATKILQRRNELGGYYSKNQLLEIWKFDQEKVEMISKFISIDRSRIKKINVNVADIDGLKSHPYISYNVANSIVKIREQQGYFLKVDQLKKSKLIDEELYLKIEPYLTIEE